MSKVYNPSMYLLKPLPRTINPYYGYINAPRHVGATRGMNYSTQRLYYLLLLGWLIK